MLVDRPAFYAFTITEQTLYALFEPSCVSDLSIEQYEQAVPMFLHIRTVFCYRVYSEQQGCVGCATHQLFTVEKVVCVVTYPVPSDLWPATMVGQRFWCIRHQAIDALL
jgi:hypothetical protein